MTLVEPKLKSSVASEEILKWVKSGRFTPGQRLPSERAMAKELRMNHLTIRRGLAELASKGIIQKRRNVGNFVATKPLLETAVVLQRYVLSQSSPHPFFSQAVAGVQEVLGERSPAALILSYRPEHLWEDIGPALIARRIRGIVLAPGADAKIEDVQRIRDAGIEVVLIKPNIGLLPLRLVSVEVDVPGAIAEVLDGILARGHRRIVIVQYLKAQQRAAYREIMQGVFRRYGMSDDDSMYLDIPSSDNSIDFSVMNRIFDRKGKDSPTAVLVYDEFMASALFRICYERDIRVPADISIASVLDSAPNLHPVPLTAADAATAARNQGRIAAEVLIRQMSGQPVSERLIYVGCDIHWRASMASLNGHVVQQVNFPVADVVRPNTENLLHLSYGGQ